MTGSDNIDEVEPCGIDSASSHPHVGRVGARVLGGQRIGQVRIQQQMLPTPLQQESALAKPPQPNMPVIAACEAYIREKRIVLQEGCDHLWCPELDVYKRQLLA